MSVEKLIELQGIDTKLKDLNDLLGDLPSKVEELDQQEESIKKALFEQKDRLKQLEVEMHKKDVSIVQINDKINNFKDQLFLVTNNKQYDALMHEIDHLKEQRATNEMESIGFLEEKETLTESVESMESELGELSKNLKVRREKLEIAISQSADEKSSIKTSLVLSKSSSLINAASSTFFNLLANSLSLFIAFWASSILLKVKFNFCL